MKARKRAQTFNEESQLPGPQLHGILVPPDSSLGQGKGWSPSCPGQRIQDREPGNKIMFLVQLFSKEIFGQSWYLSVPQAPQLQNDPPIYLVSEFPSGSDLGSCS